MGDLNDDRRRKVPVAEMSIHLPRYAGSPGEPLPKPPRPGVPPNEPDDPSFPPPDPDPFPSPGPGPFDPGSPSPINRNKLHHLYIG
jgi:hypothetical protein